jgi:toxin ParE1/3/4
MRVGLSPKAAGDIEEIGDYIHADSPAAAGRFVAGLRERCARIADMPRAGTSRPELRAGLRSVPFRRDEVRIERVLHSARDIATIFAEEQD